METITLGWQLARSLSSLLNKN